MKYWPNYFDEAGILIHIPDGGPGDGTVTGGGDSINRTGHFWFCFFVCMKLEDLASLRKFPPQMLTLNQAILKNWDSQEGCVIRHWKGYPNATDAQYGTSRDQFVPITIAALFGHAMRGLVLLNYAIDHAGCMPNFKPWRGDWNGDFLFPDHWSSLFRAAHDVKWNRTLVIWFGDLWRIGSVLIRIACLRRDKDDTGDSLNLTMELILGLVERPNFMTRFAANVFKKYSPISPQEQLDAYFWQDHAPPINELYRPLISLYLSKT